MTHEEDKEYDKTTKFGKLNKAQKLKVYQALQDVLKATDRLYYKEIDALVERYMEMVKVSSQFQMEHTPGLD